MARPNILYIHSHDTGRYVEPYGHAIPTPRLARLAREGILFRRAFCAGPTCSPSRAALLTGQYPHTCGMIGLAHRGFALRDYSHHVVHLLRGAGYTSALAGVQHIASDASGPAWKTIGYDRHLGGPDVAHERAAAFLAGGPPEPFFLSVGFNETHREFPPLGPGDDPGRCLPPAPLPDVPETREDMARFIGAARILDAKIGTVLDALDRGGLAERTLVVATTDHGIAFPRMKCNLTDGGIGVLLILRGPGGFTGGRTSDALVSHLDLVPTLCDLAEVERPARLQGTSLLPLVGGRAREVHDEIFAEVTYHAAYEPMRCVRTHRWKYIRRFDGRRRPVLPNCDDGPSKTVWLARGWADLPPPEEALYDLVLDPNEMDNLAASPRSCEPLADLRARLERWMRETDDPLLRGPVPAPAGAVVNDPDGLSPGEPTRPANVRRG